MQEGDRAAGEEAVSRIYGELRRIVSREMRRERPGHTLQTTALVNEGYIRLSAAGSLEIQSRGHFMAVASQQMRRILVDHARSAGAQRRGGGAVQIGLDAVQAGANVPSMDLLVLDESLAELERIDPRAAKVVELRYFGGYTDKRWSKHWLCRWRPSAATGSSLDPGYSAACRHIHRHGPWRLICLFISLSKSTRYTDL